VGIKTKNNYSVADPLPMHCSKWIVIEKFDLIVRSLEKLKCSRLFASFRGFSRLSSVFIFCDESNLLISVIKELLSAFQTSEESIGKFY